ncbi:hypothetical protein [Pantoea phage Nufs112]|nr:hypothetical protein [Pantoea phage Nufs112]
MIEVKYDGVKATVVNEISHSVKIRVTEKAPWVNSPEVGSVHWVRKDSNHLTYLESSDGKAN